MRALFGMGLIEGLLIPVLGERGSVEPIKRWATRIAKGLADLEAGERRKGLPTSRPRSAG
jgi:hypothetical protein